ncbi:trimethylamine-N-oxide reductase TorA [Oceanithermus sp.]
MSGKNGKGMGRRTFLKSVVGAGAAAMVAPSLLGSKAAAQSAPKTSAAARYARSLDWAGALTPSEKLTASHWGAFIAQVEDGKLVAVKPFGGDRAPVPMLQALPGRVYARSRIQYPMVREGFLKKGAASDRTGRGSERFVRVSWDDALDLVAGELERVKAKYGNASIFAGSVDWHSVGKLHNAPTLLRRMLGLFGGYTDNTGDFSVQAAMTILPHVTGNIEVYDQQTAWPTIIENTDLIVLFGADLMKNNQIGWTPPDHYAYTALAAVKERGIEVISIDPRMTDTARYLSAKWVALRPNTDVAMMLAIAHTLYTERLYDEAFLKRYTVGFDKFLDYLLGKSDGQPKTPEWAAKITEVSPGTIRDLARRMARGRTMLMGGWAIQRQDHGEQAPWMLVTLAAMLGQIGLPGGGFGFSYHYASGGSPAAEAPVLNGISAGDNPVKTAIPFAHGVSDLLLNPGKTVDYNGEKVTYPDIKLVYWAGGNPFSHQMDKNRLIRAWQRPEVTIVHDIFWTGTAKFADIVLPVTTTLERNDIDNMSEYTNQYILAMHKAVDPLFEARSDFEIFAELSDRLGFGDKFTEGKDEMGWIRAFYEQARKQAKAMKLSMPDFDTFWEIGYVAFPIPESAKRYVRYADFRRDPDLNPLGTPSGKIEIYSRTIEKFGYDDCPPHPTWLEPAEWLGGAKAKRYPLHLVSPHPKYRLHSQLDNTWIRDWYEVHEREPMWIHPDDARARGIKHGDVVRIFNDRGELLAGAYVTDRIRRGVIAVHEGAWYDPDEPGRPGALCKHGNVNTVTMDKGTSKLAQGNVANTVLVEVERYVGPVPKVTAFDPPEQA